MTPWNAGGIADARARARLILICQARVWRKVGDAWEEVAAALPCAVQSEGGATLGGDPHGRSADELRSWTLSFEHDADLRTGDRVAISGGDPPANLPEMILGEPSTESLSLFLQFTASAEVTAVEAYTATFERWDEDAGGFVEIAELEVQYVMDNPGEPRVDASGAARLANGTVILPATGGEALGAGDWVIGLPPGGAEIIEIGPVVGERRDARVRFQIAGS